MRYPGSAHDSYIWNNCGLCTLFENGDIDGWLLGDSAYPLRPWMMTPILIAATDAEERYNVSQMRARNTIERAFGLLKMNGVYRYSNLL